MTTETQSPRMINTFLTTFPGLSNLSVPLPPSTTISELHTFIANCLPPTLPLHRLHLSTASGHILSPSSSSLISSFSDVLFALRLTPTLPGGKGGFGSQLRAAGGRMSSRKKRGQEENSDSCRNLDGRRIRTVKEAKALAAYLEIKPEMDRKEKEKRRARWQKIVEMAEKREEEERGNGPVMGGQRFDDTKWLEQTEEERERTREAVLKAMREGAFINDSKKKASDNSSGASSGDDDEDSASEEPSSSKIGVKVPSQSTSSSKPASAPKFHGFDDDDEFMSSDEEDDDQEMEDIQEAEEAEEEDTAGVKGKGKAKA